MSTQPVENDVQVLKDDMRDVKDILRNLAQRDEAIDGRVAALAERDAAQDV